MNLKVPLTSGFNQRGNPISRQTQNRFNSFCNHLTNSHLHHALERARVHARAFKTIFQMEKIFKMLKVVIHLQQVTYENRPSRIFSQGEDLEKIFFS